MSLEEKMRLLICDVHFLLSSRGLPSDPAWKNYSIERRVKEIVAEMQAP